MVNSNLKYAIKIIAVIALLVFLHYTKIIKPLENAIVKIFAPLSAGIYSVGSGMQITQSESMDKSQLLNTVKILETENYQLRAENASLHSVRDENSKLKEHLNFLENNNYKYVLSRVIAEDISSKDIARESSFIINKGQGDGLLVGLPVLNSQGVLVGKITDIKDNVSKISLLTSPECKLAATIQDQFDTIGITEGELGLTLRMNFVPQEKNIKANDIIITSGLEKNIPRGIVIGKVAQVDNKKNEIWQTVVVEPLLDYNDLDIVSIILP